QAPDGARHPVAPRGARHLLRLAPAASRSRRSRLVYARPMPERIDYSEGRRLFGLDPDGYDEARPRYPAALYEFMLDAGAIRPATCTLEIGAGSGLATSKLIELGADPLTILEPDRRFAPR